MSLPASPYMPMALEEARKAFDLQEVPVGAVLVEASSGKVLARSHNEVERLPDPTAHAEILALRRGAELRGSPRLMDCDLYVTLEPCAMCAQAIAFARIRRLVFGAYDPKGGGVDHGARVFDRATCHHRPEVISGVMEQDCSNLLKDFFQQRR
ncbi:nucleoside deaminase [Rhodovibrionaceae bacterium A322]